MALCQELRADQDVAFATPDPGQRAREFAAPAGGVAINSQNTRFGETAGKCFFHALCASAHGLQVHVAASRARARDRLLPAAVMTVETPVGRVQHEAPCAAFAAGIPAAGFAGENRGIAAPIDEDEALLTAGQALTDCFDYARAEPLLSRLGAQIYGAHDRQPRAGRGALRELDALIAPLAEVVPGLERRRRGAKHHWAAGELGSIDGRVARR